MVEDGRGTRWKTYNDAHFEGLPFQAAHSSQSSELLSRSDRGIALLG